MPRRQSKPKQTRLSFNPAPSTSTSTQATTSHDTTSTGQRSNSPEEQKNREANLRYAHPSMGTLARGKLRAGVGREEGQQKQRLSSRSAGDNSSGRKKGGSLFGSGRARNVIVSDDEGEVEVVEPVKSKQKEAIAVSESSDSEPEVVSKKRKRSSSEEEEESAKSQSGSDAEEVVSGPRRKLRRGGASKPPVVVDDDEDDEDDEDGPVLATPARRKRTVTSDENPVTPKRDSDQDKLDIEADLEDLQDSGMLVEQITTLNRLLTLRSRERYAHTWPTSKLSKEQKTGTARETPSQTSR